MQDDIINNLRKEIMEKIDNLNDKFNMFEVNVTRQIAELPELLAEKFDKRYASQRRVSLLEKIVYGVVGAVCLVVLYAIIGKALGIQVQIG